MIKAFPFLSAVALTVAAAAVGCGGNNGNSGSPDMAGSTASCPRNGIIPADLRDVERAGEGLVSTTFNTAPTRTAAWDRAATVSSILKQVWGRTTSACPALPAMAAKQVDDAITALDAAISAKDQKKAVYAANSVGLACPDLFAYFMPDAPKEIIRMDAVFRQVGIDAHFGDMAASKASTASLRTDWNNAKAAVAARVPTCHRVSNTGSVAMQIETSLTNLDAAYRASDVATVETESDNGALEIDTLELLFDCPADSAVPMTGVGAACDASKKCDTGFDCDTAWGSDGVSGKCAPAASNKIGISCTSTADCGTDSRSACNTEAGDAYPGGYCFMEPCNDIDVCPPGSTCVAIGGELPGCYKSCTVDSECRTAEGYVCQLFLTTQPKGFGPKDHACAFPCTSDNDCQAPLKCPTPYVAGNASSGKCTP
ncbi:MAG: hypothetical protein JWN44_2170 [Myxococcales bacterium]|nr:hypothetical protein [Myxococcales bacterium]